MHFDKWPILTIVKYGALLLIFGLGYQLANKTYPQASAIVGWVAGFLIGIKLRLAFMDRNGASE